MATEWHNKIHSVSFAVRVKRAETKLLEAMRELDAMMLEAIELDDARDDRGEYSESAAELRAHA